MTDAEIKNTSLRVQYWMKRIKESEDKLQQCESLEKAVAYINLGRGASQANVADGHSVPEARHRGQPHPMPAH